MLVRGQTSRLPGHNEVRYIRGGVGNPRPRKEKGTINCREPEVTVPVSCLDTAAVPGGKLPPDPSPRAPVVCLVTVPVSRLDTAAVSGGEIPPGPPPRAHPLVLGHRFCLVLGHSSGAGRGNPPPDPLEHVPSCWVTGLINCKKNKLLPALPRLRTGLNHAAKLRDSSGDGLVTWESHSVRRGDSSSSLDRRGRQWTMSQLKT